MTEPERDPREAVLEIALRHAYRRGLSDGLGNGASTGPAPADVLTLLDAADPIRQLWPEVGEALEASNRLALVPTTEYGPPSKRAQIRERQELAATIDRLLTRIRALTPEGGEHG